MNEKNQRNDNSDEMLPEYDFSNGVRGKHFQTYREGHTVKIHKSDGTVDIQHFSLEDGAIMLDPDLRNHFPSSESVNKALRSLVSSH